MSDHLKRYITPRTWDIKIKGIKYVSKPSRGTHGIGMSMPINVIIRDLLNYASTTREVKYMLNNRNVLVDGIRRKDYRFPVGLFDVLSFADVNEQFRMVLNEKGKLALVKVKKEEAAAKPCKITGKKAVKGKIQLNFYDGKNMLVEKNSYSVGDVLVLSLGEKSEVKGHIKLEKGALIFLTGGKNIGTVGTVQDISGSRIIYKALNGDVFETLKEYAFPIGKEKPVIRLE